MRAEDIFPDGKIGLETWLLGENEKYRQAEIPPIGRPFRALSELSKTFRLCVAFDSPVAIQVFQWFEANTKPGEHSLGAMFTGAFLYDASFWPVSIFIGYGQFRVSPIEALDTMPPKLKEIFWRDPAARNVYLHYWLDCFDYSYGFDSIRADKRLNTRAEKFLGNGDEELRGAMAALLAHRPTLKAILALRMACEIFLKTFLIQEKNLTDAYLKKMGHKIGPLANECFGLRPYREFQIIEQGAHIFPEVSDRYDGDLKAPSIVFDAVFLTQLAGATVTRHFSDWDTRSHLTPALGRP